MSAIQKTHYRKAFNSPYLSSADIVEPTVLTIKNVRLAADETRKTKEMFNTAFFVEKEIRAGEMLKPMILNAHNSRVLKEMSKSYFIDDWNNMAVTIYVDGNVKFGRETVEGLRISSQPPRIEKPWLTDQASNQWKNAVAAYKRDGDLSKVLERINVSKENQALIIEQSNV